MRVIEHQQFKASKKNRKFHKTSVVSSILLAVLGGLWFFSSRVEAPKISHSNSPPSSNNSQTLNASTDGLKTLSSKEFQQLYLATAYPNTQEINPPPKITGSVEADKRIRDLAQAKGYQLMHVPVAPIVKINEPVLEGDDLLQEKAAKAWGDLKSAALSESIKLTLTSAYRSPEYQRSLFLGRLFSNNVSVSAIATGRADQVVNSVLSMTAPPGYSRHHTGYTIDLACGNIGLQSFANTSCYEWLSQNNFYNAKTHGWIPSYPEGAAAQGPEPEVWEFVWIGKTALTAQ